MHQVASFLDRIGLLECVPEVGPQVLRLTLITAAHVQTRSDFYFEAWSEPGDGYPKNSRVHRPSAGAVDLGHETLEIEWTGSATDIVLHAVEYKGSKQSTDLPIGEVRIPSSAVEKYILEARRNPNDLRFGTRTLELSAVERHEALRRRLRFQDAVLPGRWFTAILSRVGAETGLHIPSQAELDKLRDENKALRGENSALKSVQGGGKRTSMLDIAVRFELVPKHHDLLGFQGLIRQASFQDLRQEC